MIRFLLDDEDVVLEDTAADLTVLDWLRIHRQRTGTKEGCGSGDCGACTIIVATLGTLHNRASTASTASTAASSHYPDLTVSNDVERYNLLRYTAINSCITFVGDLHGKQLLTVESLSSGDALHPVQQAMVDEHGSQCGFCTPGFVMSLFALYHAPDIPLAWSSCKDTDSKPLSVSYSVDQQGKLSGADAKLQAIQLADSNESCKAGQADEQNESNDRPHTAALISTSNWLEGIRSSDAISLSHRIDRALGGNLCRCTGYRPIKRAAALALAARGDNCVGSSVQRSADEQNIANRLQSIAGSPIRHPYFHIPQSLEQLVSLIEAYPTARLLAGGTDLALEVTQHLKTLPRIILITRIPQLQMLDEQDGVLTLGAAVSLSRCLDSFRDRLPGSESMLLRFGSDQVRNQGTIGGNIASASPIADLPPMLIALNTILVLQRGATVREIPLQDYYLDYRKTAQQTGEFLRAVRVPLPAEGALLAIHKISKRMDDDISAVCGAFHLNIEGGRVFSVRIAYGGMAAIPKRASNAEAVLQGSLFDEDTVRRAQSALAEDFSPLSDARASAGYRLQVAQNLLYRVWVDAVKPGIATQIANYVENHVSR